MAAETAKRRPGRPKVTELPDPVTGLTKRQQAILDVIRDSVQRRGYPPSIREICESAGLASTSSVAHQLAMLEKKGFLRRDPNRPRALEVLLPGEERRAPAAAEPSSPDHSVARTSGSPRRPQLVEVDDSGVNAFPEPVHVPVVGRIAAGGRTKGLAISRKDCCNPVCKVQKREQSSQ